MSKRWNLGIAIGFVAGLLLAPSARADFVINDDLIVDGSACIGFDCVNGESFGFDSLKLKENNLRIKFDDTSTSASFPKNDWTIGANDSSNGGLERFYVEDVTGGKIPFTLEAGAPSNSMYLENSGELGLGTNNPVVDLHIVSGNTPTLRLQQDGSSGFQPQTWDVAGNETNYFIRDASNGSTLPFRIRPNAPTSSIDIEGTTGDVGFGTASPTAPIHVRRTNTTGESDVAGDAMVIVENANGTEAKRSVLELKNNGILVTRMIDTSADGEEWQFQQQSNEFRLRDQTDDINFRFRTDGDLIIEGDFITDTNTYPDYVFKPEYKLMTLDEVEKFIEKEGHLPNVPSEKEVQANGNQIKLAEMQMKLLEKVEELTLYTLQQERKIRQLEASLNELKE
jgi:hypothetical protein